MLYPLRFYVLYPLRFVHLSAQVPVLHPLRCPYSFFGICIEPHPQKTAALLAMLSLTAKELAALLERAWKRAPRPGIAGRLSKPKPLFCPIKLGSDGDA
jgi:hypothetical protein